MASSQSKTKTTTAGTKRAAASSTPKTTTRAKASTAPKTRTTTPRKRATVPDATIVTMERSGEIYRPSHDEIAARAHLLFEQSGHQHGRDEEHWHEAERQLIAERGR